MGAVSINQIADILHFDDKFWYLSILNRILQKQSKNNPIDTRNIIYKYIHYDNTGLVEVKFTGYCNFKQNVGIEIQYSIIYQTSK